MAERRFDDKEASEVLRRALELHANAAHAGKDGHTLQDLERIAAEMGVNPSYVATAAGELAAEKTEGAINLVRTLPGEVDDATWEDMVAELRRVFGRPGDLSERGNTREWRVTNETYSSATISALTRGGSTRISLMSEYSTGLWAFGLIAGGVAAVISIGTWKSLDKSLIAPLPVIVGIACFAALCLVIRWLMVEHVKGDRKKLSELMDRLAAMAPLPVDVRSRLEDEQSANLSQNVELQGG